jgi:hypothetical protein
MMMTMTMMTMITMTLAMTRAAHITIFLQVFV